MPGSASTALQPRVVSAHLPPGEPLRARVLGTSLAVADLPDPLRAKLAELLRPFVVTDARGDMEAAPETPALTFSATWDESSGLWNIYGDGAHLQGVPTDDALLRQLEWRITSAGLERVAGCGVFHAGVLARGNATVLIQGQSGAGKTTLTLGLIARGWLPLADDAAVVDVRTLGLRVFPRCFHVELARRRPVGARPRMTRVAAVAGHARPLRWAAEGRQPTAVVTVARDPNQPSSLTPLVRAEAAGALLQGAIRTPLTGSQVAHLAARIAASVQYCGHLNNSDLSHALDLIESACTL